MYKNYKGDIKNRLTKEMTFGQRYEKWVRLLCPVDKGGKGDAREWTVCAKQWTEIMICLQNYKYFSILRVQSEKDDSQKWK